MKEEPCRSPLTMGRGQIPKLPWEALYGPLGSPLGKGLGVPWVFGHFQERQEILCSQLQTCNLSPCRISAVFERMRAMKSILSELGREAVAASFLQCPRPGWNNLY